MVEKYQRGEYRIESIFDGRKLFLSAIFIFMSMAVWGQAGQVVIDDNKVSIGRAFASIEQQVGYHIIADQAIIDTKRRVELPKTQLSLDDMLLAILRGSNCTYQIRGRSIIIIKSQGDPDSLSVRPMEQAADTILVAIGGVVVDDHTGAPLMGAIVSVSGLLGREVLTDYAGRFDIAQVVPGRQNIHISSEGYHMSVREFLISPATAELQIRIKPITLSLGIADTAEIVPRTAEAAIEIPDVGVAQTKIVPLRLSRVDQSDVSLGVKSNLLYLATMSPNIGVEWAMGRRWTAEVTAGFTTFKWGENVSLNNWLVKPEVRYWLCRAFDGHLFGVHGIVGQFRVSELPFDWLGEFQKDHAYQGWVYGVGVTYGYQWAIGKRWNLEAAIGVGYLRFKYDDYALRYECKANNGSRSRNYFGPTKAGVSFIYIIKQRR